MQVKALMLDIISLGVSHFKVDFCVLDEQWDLTCNTLREIQNNQCCLGSIFNENWNSFGKLIYCTQNNYVF